MWLAFSLRIQLPRHCSIATTTHGWVAVVVPLDDDGGVDAVKAPSMFALTLAQEDTIKLHSSFTILVINVG